MSYQVKLNVAEQKELQERKKEEDNIKIYRRLECIQLKQTGADNRSIASFLMVNPNTVTEWIKLFLEGGFIKLCTLNYEGRRISKLEAHKEELRKYVEEKTPEKLAVIQSWLFSEFGIEVEATWLSRYCKKNSIFVTRKPV